MQKIACTDSGDGQLSIITHVEIGDIARADLLLHPAEGGVESGRVVCHEVRQVGHARQLVEVATREVARAHHQGNAEQVGRHAHRSLAVADPETSAAATKLKSGNVHIVLIFIRFRADSIYSSDLLVKQINMNSRSKIYIIAVR